MHRFNISKKLFDFEEDSSEGSADSVVYISSVEEVDEVSDCWDTDWSTDTEALIKRIEREVKSSPILIGGRIMTTEGLDDEMEAGPSNPQPIPPSTPKLGFKYFDEKLCYAPSRKSTKPKIELCSIVLPVLESPMSPAEHEKGPSQDTPMPCPTSSTFHASYHIQNVQPYADLGNQRCLTCMVCGKSVEEIKRQKTDWYMERSTPRSEPAYITTVRRQAYENGLNAGILLFWRTLCRRLPPVMEPKSLPPPQVRYQYRTHCLDFKTQTIKTFILLLHFNDLELLVIFILFTSLC